MRPALWVLLQELGWKPALESLLGSDRPRCSGDWPITEVGDPKWPWNLPWLLPGR